MNSITSSEAAKAVVRRNTEEVQNKGNFQVFEELFADDFIDHTPQPSTTPDKAGVRKLYTYLRAAFPDFRAEIHWQLADGDRVTTYKTYRGTHQDHSWGSLQVTAESNSKRSMSCACKMEKSRTTGAWETFYPLCSRLAVGFRPHKR